MLKSFKDVNQAKLYNFNLLWNFIAIQVIQSLGVCIVYMELHSSFELGSKVLKFEKKTNKQSKTKSKSQV